jgi:3-hydroxyacyl-[acyl-carrier-protein] dehydratase
MLSLEESLQQSLRQWRFDKQGEDGFSLSGEFRFKPSFPGFNGHFPEQPVLPAIVQLAAVRHLAELALDRKLVLIRCQRVKFRGMVLPQEVLQVAVRLSQRVNGWQAEFSLQKAEGMVAGGLLDLSQEDR